MRLTPPLSSDSMQLLSHGHARRGCARLAVAAALAFAWAPGLAAAQESLSGYALNQFDPSPAGDALFAVPSATTNGELDLRAQLMFDHAFDPLVFGEDASVVSGQGFLRASGSLSLIDRLLVSVDVPVALVQSGDSPTISGVALRSPDSVEMGDVRLGLRGNLYGRYFDPFQIALNAAFFFPTAGEDSLAGDGSVRVHPEVSLGGRVGEEHAFQWGAAGGVMVHGRAKNPHAITYGAGAGAFLADDLVQLSAEVFGSTQIGDAAPLSTPNIVVRAPTGTSLELLLGSKVRVLGGLVFGAAAGPGMTAGLGTPSARVVGLAGWAPVPERDRSFEDDDGDGVLNGKDACPALRGVESDDPKRNGCAPPDRDEDKVPDALDACPSLAGRVNADKAQSGCPTDYDRDGVPDREDACPNQKGVSSIDPARNGCPGEVDADLDGIADRQDACPNEKGSINDDPSKHGCPTEDGDRDGIVDREDACPSERGLPDLVDTARHGCPKDVRVTTGEIVILRQVHFNVGMSTLDQTVDPVSDDLLTEVRDVILQHPEIQVIEVQGHADDTGTAEFNVQLSQQRADAVRTWLARRGIDKARLVARGYGANRPIATNQTEEGRLQNRRVQFVIVKKK